MKVLLPFLRTAYAFRSVHLAAASGEKPYHVETTMPTTSMTTPETTTTTTTATTELARLLPPLPKGSRRVILVRHAETDWNARGLLQGGSFDVKLNDKGRQQAQALADELVETFIGNNGINNNNNKIDVVASSHLARAEETADIVYRACIAKGSVVMADTSPPVRIINHKFGEMRFGEFEGLAVRGPDCTDQTRRRMRDLKAVMHRDNSAPWPGGGESVADVEGRVGAGLRQLLRGFPDCDHFCVVGHGRANKIIVASLLGLTGMDSVQQGNTGINVLDVDGQGNWKAHAINYLGHCQRAKATNE